MYNRTELSETVKDNLRLFTHEQLDAYNKIINAISSSCRSTKLFFIDGFGTLAKHLFTIQL